MRAHHFIATLALFALLPARGYAQTLVLETADASANNVGSHTSLALDASGNPHMSYIDAPSSIVKYARKILGEWMLETADGTANLQGLYTSLAVDASGNPHVSYTSFAASGFKYAWRSPFGYWTIETAGSVNGVGYIPSITLDASGNPHVTYYGLTTQDLNYARKSGGVWTLETADATTFAGIFSSLALDALGNPHVSYQDWDGSLKYARRSGGVWTLEKPDGSANIGGSASSLTLDASGNPHVSYQDGLSGELRYARKSGGVWAIEAAVDGTQNVAGANSSIALDALGNPHVAYFDWETGDLMYARKIGGVWGVDRADGSTNDVGRYASLALDASGNPHVGYYDQTIGDLKYAYIPGVLIASPQPGVTWPVGSEQTIVWSFTGGLSIDNSDVYLSVDGGNSFVQIRNDARAPGVTLRVPHTPSRFASIKIIRPSPYTEAYMDSFFTIDATIALNKFDARVVGDGESDASAKGASFARDAGEGFRGSAAGAGRAVALTWETTPGREADIRYRIERAASDDASAVFAPLNLTPLDANEYLDADADAAAGASALGARYRLIAINGLGEEYALGETAVAPALAPGRFLSAAPNPAPGGATSFAFRTAQDGLPTDLVIYDLSGRRVATVASGSFSLGSRAVTWDGRSDAGEPVAAGVYFARLSWGGVPRATERVTVVR